MKVLACAAVRRRLEAFHDGELPVGDQISVTSHLEWCEGCASKLDGFQAVRSVLRASAPSRVLSNEDGARLQADVVSRAKAEDAVSLPVVVREMFEDMHFVYAGMGALAAALVCGVISLGMFRAATETPSEGLILGSNQYPLSLGDTIRMPRAIDAGFASAADLDGGDLVFTFAAVLTREGLIASVELVPSRDTASASRAVDDQRVNALLGVASRARFEPASKAGSPVAVNMVWVVAHTTVRGTTDVRPAPPVRGTRRRSASLDLVKPDPLPVQA